MTYRFIYKKTVLKIIEQIYNNLRYFTIRKVYIMFMSFKYTYIVFINNEYFIYKKTILKIY